MKDQAEALRKKMEKKLNGCKVKTLAVVSGKGGVGKSNFSLNFAISLCNQGRKVLLFDMDIGMGNIDILIGKHAKHSIVDYFDNDLPLGQIVSNGPGSLEYIAGGSGLNRLFNVEDAKLEKFAAELSSLIDHYDYVIFDMGAGVSKQSMHFILSTDEIIVISTPEPTSLTDAYAMMKHIHLENHTGPFYVVINRVQKEKEGKNAFKRLEMVAKRFLERDLFFLGSIPDDKSIPKAVTSQTPFIFNEKSQASRAILKMSEIYVKQQLEAPIEINHVSFVSKLKRFLFER